MVNETIHFNQMEIEVVSKEDNDYWFVANKIAEAIGYTQPRAAVSKIINRHREDFEGFSTISSLVTEGSNQRRQTLLLNEQGVYMFCMFSRTPLATEFRRMTAQKIKEWRKGGGNQSPDLLDQQIHVLNAMHQEMKNQKQEIHQLREDLKDVRRGFVSLDQPFRNQFVQDVRRICQQYNIEYRALFNEVYKAILRNDSIDIKKRAKNRTKKLGRPVRPLDILEEMKMIPYAIQIVKIIEKEYEEEYQQSLFATQTNAEQKD